MRMRSRAGRSWVLLAILAGWAWAGGLALCPPAAAEVLHHSFGQTVYVPAYTQVYYSDKGDVFPLVATLLVHNTDMQANLSVESVKLYDTHGKLVKEYLNEPKVLAPFGSLDILAPRLSKTQGVGACFVVQWQAAHKVAQPILECVMIGASSQQGISIRSQGRVIAERKP